VSEEETTRRGEKERSKLTLSGHPMMAKGQRPDENQVSRTSSSCSRVYFLPLATLSARAVASSRVRPTTQESLLEAWKREEIRSQLEVSLRRKENTRSTHVGGNSLDLEKVSRASMSPPKLSRDTPILHRVHPSVPVGLVLLGRDDHLSSLSPL